MNTKLFDQASVRYKNKDYRGALRGYTQCLQDTSVPFSLGEVGLIYHRIGNCLVKLKSHPEAIQAYKHALEDPSYNAKGSLQNNIGMAYASLRNYQSAADYFQAAIDDPTYDSSYKAYMGLGNAELKLGRSAEAGVAFREAALDEENPDPAKSLLNLGICFMALDRPEDAILSYKSALQFDMTEDTRNRINASMGQAYVANGQMPEAVAAFEAAIAGATYVLSDSASVDHQRALAELARLQKAGEAGFPQDALGASQTQMLGSGIEVPAPPPGYPTQEFKPHPADTSGFDIQVTDAFMPAPADLYKEELDAISNNPGYVDAYKNTSSNFFTTPDSEIEALAKVMAKKDRRNRNVGLKILVAVIIVVLVALAGAVALYMQGFGIPTQQTVVTKLFENPENAKSEGLFSNGLSDTTLKSMLDPVIADAKVKIDAVQSQSTESTVYASASTGKGGSITYKITLARDFLGWKISGIELYFPSMAQ